jgi:hypothetical protein
MSAHAIIEVDNKEDAIRIASEWPAGGAVEMRPVEE